MRVRPRKLLLGGIALLVLLYLALGVVLGSGKTIEARHMPVVYPPFAFTDGSFDDYARYAADYLRATRVENSAAAVVDRLLPFLLEPGPECARLPDGRYPRGIVLTHGLLDSPYSMRDLGEALRQHCLLVYGLLLPAHGSRPGALLDARWEQWQAAEHWAAQRLGERADSILLGGHSLGGTLALLESSRNARIDGLVLFAPALAIADVSKYAKFLTPLGALFPKAAWFEVAPDEALYRYESLPFRAAQETWDLIQQTWQEERAMHRNLPTFTVLAAPDSTVDTQAALDFMAGNSHPLSHTLLYSQHPAAATERLTVVPSGDPAQAVLSLSHLGLMVPPQQPYYGRDGSYRSCGHYPLDSTLFTACKAGQRQWYGEITSENLAQGTLERIAFNPYYDAMLTALSAFLETLAPASP